MENNIPRMVTIKEASKLSGLSYYILRQWCLDRSIVSVRCGSKILVNLESLTSFLNGGDK